MRMSESSNGSLDVRISNQRKKALKEEKKRLREEEIRRGMLAPKGQALRLVSQKLLEDFRKNNAECMSFSTYHIAAPVMNEKEFPTVEESRKRRVRLSEGHSCGVQKVDVQENIPNCETQVKLNHLGRDYGDCVKFSSAEEDVIVATNSVSVKNRKRKDPIKINLVNLMKAQPSRHNKGPGEKGTASKVNSQTRKRDDLIRYSGNQLDASNPERKRGKKREIPKKKKVSVLKSVILEERALRQHPQAFQTLSGSVDTQKEGGVTADGSACLKQVADETVLLGMEDVQSHLCDRRGGEVTDNDVRKDEGVSAKEMIHLTKSLKESLHLSTSYEATVLPKDVSCGTESNEDVMCTGERGELTCAVVPSGLHPRGCMEEHGRPAAHSRKFREYCDNCLTAPLNIAVKLLLTDIVKFQDRLYHRDPVKAFAKRRYVLGFREVMKFLQLKKLKLVVIAPDLEVSKQKGGIDDVVAKLKEESAAQGLPCLFALSRRELGYLTFKKVGVSCIGVCSYEGSESNFKDVMESLPGARAEYEQRTQHAVIVQNPPVQPTVGATHEPDDGTDETATLTSQVIASLLSKLVEHPSATSASRLLSAIERPPSHE